jgi:hypothetical protein
LPEDSRKLLTRGRFFNPSLDGGLPLLLRFSPRRRSSSASRAMSAMSAVISLRSNALLAYDAASIASTPTVAGVSSRELESSGRAIDTLTRTAP